MEKTNDGFKIADEDLKLRGPGEFIGERQSGFLSYKIANMITDGPIISDARAAAFSIIEKDPSLENSVNEPMKRWFMSHYSKYLEKINLS